MPLTQVRTFRVRYYECDANGCVNHANYLRYMQEAAFDASAAAGYGMTRYEAMERYWLIRETDIECLHPLRYGDSVQVKTWVADFRRIRSRRAYEFRLAGSGDLVARALTDWVFLDSVTGRPAPIPTEMKVSFFPEGPPESALRRSCFPAAPPPPPSAFRLSRQVEWRDLDQVQHVNNAVYLAYIEDCGVKATTAHGWPPVRMQEAGPNFLARRHQIEYLQPAVLDDELELTTWLSDVQHSTALRHFAIARVSDGLQVVRARTLWEWTDRETGNPIRIPEAFLADLAPNTAHGPATP
jgi:acyl-CoA thioester hydrolase